MRSEIHIIARKTDELRNRYVAFTAIWREDGYVNVRSFVIERVSAGKLRSDGKDWVLRQINVAPPDSDILSEPMTASEAADLLWHRLEAWKIYEIKCTGFGDECGGPVTYAPDPYELDTNDDHTPIWMCSFHRYQQNKLSDLQFRRSV